MQQKKQISQFAASALIYNSEIEHYQKAVTLYIITL